MSGRCVNDVLGGPGRNRTTDTRIFKTNAEIANVHLILGKASTYPSPSMEFGTNIEGMMPCTAKGNFTELSSALGNGQCVALVRALTGAPASTSECSILAASNLRVFCVQSIIR